jgi:hypothetical protein
VAWRLSLDAESLGAQDVPLLDQQFRARKRPVGSSLRMDETCVRVRGAWRYLYRAVDKAGATVDFLLTANRPLFVPQILCRQILTAESTEITVSRGPQRTIVGTSPSRRLPIKLPTMGPPASALSHGLHPAQLNLRSQL